MSSIDVTSPDKKTIRRYFNEVAFRYDFLNGFLSFRLDEGWRRRAARMVLNGNQQTVLDLGVGTGKFLETLQAMQPWRRAVGLDFAAAMLQRARAESKGAAQFVSADFHDLPFRDGAFDLVVSSFTLRSVKDLPRFLGEIHRIMSPAGKVGLLCLTRPENPLWQALYYPYLKFYIPLMGCVMSGHREAYRFLSDSIGEFQRPEETMKRMSAAGFSSIQKRAFTFGAATLLVAEK
ncbi:MAG: ubiquinone/menaquinone biosynthesis methyltransferase [Candidatus Omnitrophota bacterium]|nr:ubiquinone/menaquinone biosynthesis methyltransferase [Candidatus Omnitrophota bacterium]